MSKLQNAQFGAKALQPGTDRLPGVFPREMGPNALPYLEEVVKAGLASDMYERFTSALARLYGVRYAIGTPGCTQAVFAAMLGMDFPPGSEIIVSPISDYGSVAGILFENYVPVFADVEPGTALVSADTIRPLITERTRAILCVHMLGVPCDMDPIMDLAERHGLLVITDVCQAVLAEYRGSLSKTLGHAGCFSFDAEKTCGGDIGGAVLTDDKELYERIENRAIARGGFQVPGFGRSHTYRGFATRMPQCTAATCLANMEILPRQVANRQKMAALLDGMIGHIDGIIPYRVPENRTHTYWMYGFSVDPRRFRVSPDTLATELAAEGIPGIGMGKYYLMPAALPFLKEGAEKREHPYSLLPRGWKHTFSADAVPNARAFLDTWIRWPWTEKYTPDHVRTIAGMIEKVADRNRP